MADAPVFEDLNLGRLREWGGGAFLADLIDIFLREASARLEKARQAEAEGDLEMVALTAHSLKSSAHIFGALQFHELAARTEEAAHSRDGEAVLPLLKQLEEAFVPVREHLRVTREGLNGG